MVLARELQKYSIAKLSSASPGEQQETRYLSEELLQERHGPAVVQVPCFRGMADVCCVQHQG